jgi:hypothetical protein
MYCSCDWSLGSCSGFSLVDGLELGSELGFLLVGGLELGLELVFLLIDGLEGLAIKFDTFKRIRCSANLHHLCLSKGVPPKGIP